MEPGDAQTGGLVTHAKAIAAATKDMVAASNALNEDESASLDTVDDMHVTQLKNAVTQFIGLAKQLLANPKAGLAADEVTAARDQVHQWSKKVATSQAIETTRQQQQQVVTAAASSAAAGSTEVTAKRKEEDPEKEENNDSSSTTTKNPKTIEKSSSSKKLKAFGGRAWKGMKSGGQKMASGSKKVAKKLNDSRRVHTRGLREKWKQMKIDRQEAKRTKDKMKQGLNDLKAVDDEEGPATETGEPSNDSKTDVKDDLAKLDLILDQSEMETADDVAQSLLAVKKTRESIERKTATASNQPLARQSVMVLRDMEKDLVQMLKRTSQRASQQRPSRTSMATKVDERVAAAKPTPAPPAGPDATMPPSAAFDAEFNNLGLLDEGEGGEEAQTSSQPAADDFDVDAFEEAQWDDIDGLLQEYGVSQ